MNGHHARNAAIAALCVLAAAAAISCASLKKSPPRVLEAGRAASGDALAAAARFVAADDKVPGFFKEGLGEKGVIAVQAVIRNDGPSPLLVYASNGMEIGPGFAGIRLVCGADTMAPLHPGEVTAILAGARRSRNYRHPGAFELVASPLLPPFGVYTLYKEASVGRFYRPLFGRSLHPPLPSGLLAPIRLEPGVERRGWLYFEAPSGAGALAGEMLVTACAPIETPDRIAGYDFEFCREEEPAAPERGGAGDTAGAAPRGDREDGFLFSLVREGARSGLRCASVRALLDGPHARSARVAEIAAKSAEIADVSRRGGRAAVALNFTSKSRVLVLDCGDDPAIADDRAFARGIRRVFSVADGIYALTENGFGHFFGDGARAGVSGTKLTRGFGDAAVSGGRIHVFSEDKGLMIFDASASSRFALLEKPPVRRGDRRVVGALDGVLALLCRGGALAGDTLVFFDPSTKAEIRRGVLAGRVIRASTARSSVVAQLEDGTVLRIAAGPLGSFRILEAGWLPFGARAIEALPGAFIAVGADGSFAAGGIGAFRPGSRGAVEVSATVE
jgi:hypothetical protein